MLRGNHALGRALAASALLLVANVVSAQLPGGPELEAAAPITADAPPPAAEGAAKSAAGAVVGLVDVCELDVEGVCVDPALQIRVGTSYHPFNHPYFLTGLNWAWSLIGL